MESLWLAHIRGYFAGSSAVFDLTVWNRGIFSDIIDKDMWNHFSKT